MDFELNQSILILKRTPATLYSLLKDLPEEWSHKNEGDNTWSAFDIIGHLIHGEKTDWIPRARIILGDNSNKEFEPFDRFAQFENSKGKTLNELLTNFNKLREENIRLLLTMNISENDLNKEGVHPEFGIVSLRQLLATWVTHDLGHIAQITRVMAKQYNHEVGPWKEYIGILSK